MIAQPLMNSRDHLVDVALGREPADLVVEDCRVANVHTGEIIPADIVVVGGRVAYVGEAGAVRGAAPIVVGGRKRLAVPGLIDCHIHTYESHLPVSEVSRAMLLHGVTCIITDFYGEAVVRGVEAVRASLDEAASVPLHVVFVTPTPALYQDRPFAHTGTIDLDAILEILAWPECSGVNECFARPVLEADAELRALIEAARAMDKGFCGHASEIDGDEIQAWIGYLERVDDHEATQGEEALAKARAGIHVIAREGSGVSDARAILEAVASHDLDTRHFSFCSDLLSPLDLVNRGDIDYCVRLGVEAGIAPMKVLQMATINGAEARRIDHVVGSISPGRRADIVLLEGDLSDFTVGDVVCEGGLVVSGGEYVGPTARGEWPSMASNTVKVGAIDAGVFRVQAGTGDSRRRVRVIGVRDGSLVTEEMMLDLPVAGGDVQSDPERDVLKIASFERHGHTGSVGLGFVHGFGLRRGAVASTYNPHCQNLVVVGCTDAEMVVAADECRRMGGGFAVAVGERIAARVPLPLYGLLSKEPVEVLAGQIEEANRVLRENGCGLSAPFHTLAFSGLPVSIGRLKISPAGLIDVWNHAVVPILVE